MGLPRTPTIYKALADAAKYLPRFSKQKVVFNTVEEFVNKVVE